MKHFAEQFEFSFVKNEKLAIGKHHCDCGELAVWAYRYSHYYYCDECVPRGCSCETEYIPGTRQAVKNGHSKFPPEGGQWKWIEKNISWRRLDKKGRERPCSVFSYSEDGFEVLT